MEFVEFIVFFPGVSGVSGVSRVPVGTGHGTDFFVVIGTLSIRAEGAAEKNEFCFRNAVRACDF